MLSGRRIVRRDAESLVFLPLDPLVVEMPGAPRRDGFSVKTTLRGWGGDVSVQLQLRALYADAVPHGGRSATFEEMAGQVASRVDQGGLRAYRVHDAGGAGATPAAFKSGDDKAVPFVDDAGKPVLNKDGGQMMRPAGLPPDFFVDQGRSDEKTESALLSSGGEGGGAAVLGYTMGALSKFRQGGSWDAQRIGGINHAGFVDYSTVAIAIYAAASKISRSDILIVQNSYAALKSRYPADKEMDPDYRHLPAVNVWNTDLGFKLVETGRIGPTKRP